MLPFTQHTRLGWCGIPLAYSGEDASFPSFERPTLYDKPRRSREPTKQPKHCALFFPHPVSVHRGKFKFTSSNWKEHSRPRTWRKSSSYRELNVANLAWAWTLWEGVAPIVMTLHKLCEEFGTWFLYPFFTTHKWHVLHVQYPLKVSPGFTRVLKGVNVAQPQNLKRCFRAGTVMQKILASHFFPVKGITMSSFLTGNHLDTLHWNESIGKIIWNESIFLLFVKLT